MNAKLKICGMKVPENILTVAALQPDYLGFIFYKGSKRYVGDLSADFIKAIASVKKTGVFVDEVVELIAAQILAYGLDAVQLHGAESPEFCAELRLALPPATEIIKAFGVNEYFDFDRLEAYLAHVDYFLFDTQTPDHGGSGKTFNWTLLKKYTLDKPYFLSGGISMDSVEELNNIDDPRLYAIDVNSRFETAHGVKNIDQLIDFKNMLSY